MAGGGVRWRAVLAFACALGVAAPALASPKHGDESGADPNEVPYFVFISPVLVPLVKDGRLLGNVFVHLNVEVDGSDAADAITRIAPRLRGRFTQALYNVPELTDDDGRLDIEAVKRRLLPVARKYADGTPVRGIVVTRITPADR